MTFELLPTAGYWAAAILAIAVIGGLLAIVSLGEFLVRNHSVRVERHLSIPTYYRGLALSH